jgi:hypothetical protein
VVVGVIGWYVSSKLSGGFGRAVRARACAQRAEAHRDRVGWRCPRAQSQMWPIATCCAIFFFSVIHPLITSFRAAPTIGRWASCRSAPSSC